MAIKLSKREKTLAMIALGAAMFYVFYQFLLVPKLEETDKLKTEAKKLRLELKVAEQKIKILEQVEKRLGTVEQRQPKREAVEVEEEALKVLRALAQTTSSSKLKLLSIKPIIGKGNTLRFELLCTGTYQQLYSFLEILHGLDILMLIDSLNVTSRGSQSGDLDIKVSLTAHL
ncbi:MAG: hypothetical protein JW782_01730 [Candidatus Saganbacteria bacterium]|nr:hypothetical protein [Candidatus Saganbacteria bacterium]